VNELPFTLLADGSSDRVLLPILKWAVVQQLPDYAVLDGWADMGQLPQPPKGLSARVKAAVELYPCRLLFVHRDAETRSLEARKREILKAVEEAGIADPPAVCVVPVRMTEAWLLLDEPALRMAAGNPSGTTPLALPPAVESLPDPKSVLHELLRSATGLTGRRRDKFRPALRAQQIPHFMENISVLRALGAFCAMERDLHRALCVNLGLPALRPERSR